MSLADEELAAIRERFDLYLGIVVECSCGKRFTKCDDQRDGPYWSELNDGYPHG